MLFIRRSYIVIMLLICIHSKAQQSYLLEAEDFQFKGGWVVEHAGKAVSGERILRVMAGGKSKAADALTVVSIRQAGNYAVWTRSADYAGNRPGTRLCQLQVNEQTMEESGKHGKEGYYWEKVGQVQLPAGEAVIRLIDSRGNFARCDAVLLTQAGDDPNNQALTALAAHKAKPIPQKATAVQYPTLAPAVTVDLAAAPVAAISNNYIRLRFVPVKGGEQRLAVKTEIKQKNRWLSIDPLHEDHKVYVIQADNPQPGFGNFFLSWNGSHGFTHFTHQGKQYRLLEPDNAMNPFMAGVLKQAIPVTAKQVDNTTIEVEYAVEGKRIVKGKWRLAPNNRHIGITLQLTPVHNGYYSLGVAAFQGSVPDSVTNIQLPPMFQYQRLSPQPILLPSGMMPQPLAIVETKTAQGLWTSFASGAAQNFPLEWGSAYSSPMGFAVKNEMNQVQPVAFAPVLGLDGSKLEAGATVQKEFVIGATTGNWNDALEYISDSIYTVKDYRSQKGTSLTEAAFNMVDLIRNDSAAGWSAPLKGFYDIEANPAVVPTVVQSSPLTLVSAAVLGRDEDFYIKRALPTIEYTLSRSGFRWAKAVSGTTFNSDSRSLRLSPFGSQFTTNYFEGLYQFLGEANPWLEEIALPDGAIRNARGYSVEVPDYTQQLAAWRLTKEEKWLNTAKASANAYIKAQVYGKLTKPLSRMPFYNAAFYAYWWDLIDLYDETKEPHWLKAAETSAFQTLAGIRSFPLVKDTLQTIHPGGQFEGNTTMWWKGDKKYRLGFPRTKGDAPEKKLPQSDVSPVGLGFEQPFTYFDAGKTVRPVFMSSWAPHLLRLFDHTHRTIFHTYARNAVIGRFTNYPGYYASGFTDITMQPDFPYKGPDVSSIYYHHIPPHLAFTLDYVITEAIQRSNGKVHFPHGKQDGFVWFNNRIFGGGQGTVYDDSGVRLWMKKGLVTINTPQVNYVTAISDNRFWILLMNEADTTLQAAVQLGAAIPVNDRSTAGLYGSTGRKRQAALNNRQLNVALEAKGFAALSFPLNKKNIEATITPVENGMKVIDLGLPWGKCYVFRIRSPFGWDSIYGYLETSPLPDAAITVSCGDKTVTQNEYPYEWSFYKLEAGKPLQCTVQVKAGGQTKNVTVDFE
ncbi:hypothetical protein [Longitalea luteola]|uniref:hypothetical protein n=1 Tax=Longitalea luteola TaxID=2812563 RepID=UPI001A96505C|nr:hypothetical protein [Longitalea luteola]